MISGGGLVVGYSSLVVVRMMIIVWLPLSQKLEDEVVSQVAVRMAAHMAVQIAVDLHLMLVTMTVEVHLLLDIPGKGIIFEMTVQKWKTKWSARW